MTITQELMARANSNPRPTVLHLGTLRVDEYAREMRAADSLGVGAASHEAVCAALRSGLIMFRGIPIMVTPDVANEARNRLPISTGPDPWDALQTRRAEASSSEEFPLIADLMEMAEAIPRPREIVLPARVMDDVIREYVEKMAVVAAAVVDPQATRNALIEGRFSVLDVRVRVEGRVPPSPFDGTSRRGAPGFIGDRPLKERPRPEFTPRSVRRKL